MKFFEDNFPKNDFGFIVGKISTNLQNLLKVEKKEVIFSEVSILKNRNHHRDLKNNEYLLLPFIIGKSHFIIKDGIFTIAVVFIKIDNIEIFYHYALKITKTKKNIFLTSFRKTSLKDIKRLRKKAIKQNLIILKDFIP